MLTKILLVGIYICNKNFGNARTSGISVPSLQKIKTY